jgi:hypothetical protein
VCQVLPAITTAFVVAATAITAIPLLTTAAAATTAAVAATATAAATTAVATTATAAAAATTAVATTATAATAATTTATAEAAWAFFFRTCFVNGEVTTTKIFAIQPLNRGSHSFWSVHRDESETTRAAAFTIDWEEDVGNGAKLGEKLTNIYIGSFEGEIPHIHLGVHILSVSGFRPLYAEMRYNKPRSFHEIRRRT